MARQLNVFIWNDYRQWRKAVLLLLADLVDKKVLDELRKNPPRYFLADNLAWLDKAIQKVKGIPTSDIHATFNECFLNHYPFIRLFHGCRPQSIESYKKHGIQLCDPTTLDELAFQIFQKKKAVESAIKDLAINYPSYREHNQGKVYFCLERDDFAENCGHYLLYGSEYLGAIGFKIGEEEALRKRGRATVIECNVPTSDIPIGYIKCLTGQILKKIALKYYLRRPCDGIMGFGLHITRKLEPENIKGFHFPTGIRNSHKYNLRED
jgi:hypothetical protein